ncbi:MAG TPA: V-type ATPase subunit [Spirochaetota bacterium]|nr:V-type ATPase subunit [Spirochaetota bacterium]
MASTGNSWFLFVTGMVRALENRMLGRGNIEGMLRAETGDDVLGLLRNTRYSTFPDLSREPFVYESLVKSAREQLFNFIDKYSGDTGAGYIFRADYDYHNMKILLRRKITGEEKGDLLSGLGSVSSELMEEIFEHELYDLLPAVMRDSVSAAIEAYFTHKRLALINPVFDTFLFRDLLESEASGKSWLIRNYIRRRIDAANIMTILRMNGSEAGDDSMEYLFIDGGFIDTGLFLRGDKEYLKLLQEIAVKYDLTGLNASLSDRSSMLYAAERECRAMMMRELETADFMITGVEPLFAYGCRADEELKNIGMIISSKYPEFNRGIIETMLARGGE